MLGAFLPFRLEQLEIWSLSFIMEWREDYFNDQRRRIEERRLGETFHHR
jgi:hypothetical protein